MYFFGIAGRMAEDAAFLETRKKMNLLATQNKFSGVVVVAKNGRTLFTHAVGMADRERKISNSIRTKFNLASMGKMFTGVAIAQLVQQGKLKFSDTLGQYIDYCNEEVSRLTIHQLLTHTSGLGDFFGEEFDKNKETLKTPADYIKLFGNLKPEKFEPNVVIYSNYAYVLLGAVIEKTSSQSFDAYIKQYIFDPLGMHDSSAYLDKSASDNIAVGYNEDTPAQIIGNGSPAGGGYSTVEDMLKFANGLTNNILLQKEYIDIITTGKVSALDYMYGYGFMDQQDPDGVRFFGHCGGCIGMNTELRIYPKSGYTIIMLSNTNRWRPSVIAEFVGTLLPNATV